MLESKLWFLELSRLSLGLVYLLLLVVGVSLHCQTAYSAMDQYPNLSVAAIYPICGPKWLPMLPRVSEPFYIGVIVVNSEESESGAFRLRVQISWGLASMNVTSLDVKLDGLKRGYSWKSFGPYIIDRPSNVTVSAVVNQDRMAPESDYSDNSLTNRFTVGALYPSLPILEHVTLWCQSENSSLRDSVLNTFLNGVTVAMSNDGNAVAIASDDGHVSLYKNQTRIYETRGLAS